MRFTVIALVLLGLWIGGQDEYMEGLLATNGVHTPDVYNGPSGGSGGLSQPYRGVDLNEVPNWLTTGYTLMALAEAVDNGTNIRDTPSPAVDGVPTAPDLQVPHTPFRVGPQAQVPPVSRWAPLVCNPPFTWDCTWALAIIDCESSGNPSAYNPAGPYYGLFQVLNGPLDPYANAVEAHIQYVEWQAGMRSVSPWPNCP